MRRAQPSPLLACCPCASLCPPFCLVSPPELCACLQAPAWQAALAVEAPEGL